jgi:hypothetical protein
VGQFFVLNSRFKLMKIFLIFCLLLGSLASGWAATTISAVNKYAYGANVGWMDCRGDTANGAVIGDYVCSGYIYAANAGWINLGGGSPTNGIRYLNLAANDFGVNHDGVGNLRGYAYGANIGWINFEITGAPTLDLKTGKMSGYAYSANCGWISLSNAFAFVQTDTIAPGADTDSDGIADAWEKEKFGNLTTANASSNSDGDPKSDLQEYLADTIPTDPNSYLRITAQSFASGGTNATLRWTSMPTRFYHIEKTLNLGAPAWSESVLGSISPDAGSSTMRSFTDTNAPVRFYRVRAARPLTP